MGLLFHYHDVLNRTNRIPSKSRHLLTANAKQMAILYDISSISVASAAAAAAATYQLTAHRLSFSDNSRPCLLLRWLSGKTLAVRVVPELLHP